MESHQTVRVGKTPLTLFSDRSKKKLGAIVTTTAGNAFFWVSASELERALRELKKGSKARSSRCRSSSKAPSKQQP